MTQIEIRDLSMRYLVGGQEITAVRGAALEIEHGDFISIVGHSGSGKTTLLSLIGGIIRPTAGKVLYEGVDICAMDDDGMSRYRNEQIGFMFQFASLLPRLTVRENLLLPAVFRAQQAGPVDAAALKAAQLLRMVGLEDKIDAYPARLSGGQQRRVAIARAFMNRPALVLADEPTGDLDEATEQEMMDFFIDMNRTEGTTFVMVTHNTDLAGRTKRRLHMHQGVLREE